MYRDHLRDIASFYEICKVDGVRRECKRRSIEKLVDNASAHEFDISSDYQQDKSILSWNSSPRPGATYFMSAITHYVHIIVLDSLGEPWVWVSPSLKKLSIYKV